MRRERPNLFGKSLGELPPGPWQRERIAKLGYSGPMPNNAGAAKALIQQLESRRGAA